VDILIHLLWVIGGLAALYFGAEWLVKGAADIALKIGISPLVVGLTVVAFGTSAPELLVCLKANGQGQPGVALGNIIGSNICNIALILGVGALIKPIVIHKQVIKREMPILLIATAVFIGMMFSGKEISRWEGGLLLAGVIIYVAASFIQSKKENSEESDEFSADEVAEARKAGPKELAISAALVVIGLVVLKIGADLLVEHGVALAQVFGVSEAIIALLLLALGTSLPELATSVVAAKNGQGDIITGNAVGSCIFNILAVMGATGLVKAIAVVDIKPFDLWVMVGVIVAITPMMWTRMKLGRIEGAILLTAYLAYCGTRFAMEKGMI